MLKPVTLWYRIDGDAVTLNHLEDGHNEGNTPTIKHPAQAGWAKAKWASELVFLNGRNQVVRQKK